MYADLDKSEAQKAAILEAGLDCIVAVDDAGTIVEFNPAAENTFGWKRAEVIGRSAVDVFISPSIRQEFVTAMTAIVAGPAQKGRRLEITAMRADGMTIPVELSLGVFQVDGRAIYSASMRDLTERNRSKAEQAEVEGRFQLLFDRAAIGIARVDLRGRLVEVNPALANLLGYTSRALIGKTIARLIHPDDRDATRFGDLLAGRSNEIQFELRYQHHHGGEVWGNTIVSVVRDAGGEPLYMYAMVEDITLRKGQEAALEHRALHDALTDLPNRSLLFDRLNQALNAARRDRHQVALMMIDLDGFKDVNDALGHACGDAVLQEVADRLRRGRRSSDTLARLGGDEFAVIIPKVNSRGAAEATARKILAAMRPAFEVESDSINLGASIGIALFPEHGDDAKTLMRQADLAMYAAKRSRAGYVVHTETSDTA